MASVAIEMTGYCEEGVMALLLKAGWCNMKVVGGRVRDSQGLLLPSKFLLEDSKLAKRRPGPTSVLGAAILEYNNKDGF
ncbi:hypothetical protein E2320_014775 [Naja naja]|nr:hypothetical protein E2320_014775 [Naja naja]